jgi:hypothetical protein
MILAKYFETGSKHRIENHSFRSIISSSAAGIQV